MIYVVHTVKDGERRKFATFSRAFKEFKASLRNDWYEQHSVALWTGSSHDGWTRIYQSQLYPEKYTSPYCKDV